MPLCGGIKEKIAAKFFSAEEVISFENLLMDFSAPVVKIAGIMCVVLSVWKY